MTPQELRRFELMYHVEPNTGCWLWLGANAGGYGRFSIRREGFMRTSAAHRVAYEHWNGQIPPGLEIDHVRARGCCGPACVNPAHLEAVTHRENVLRGEAPPARAAGQDRCQRGHAEWGLHSGGKRFCKVCRRAAARLSYRKHTSEGAGE